MEAHCDYEFHIVMDNYSINQDPPIHMNFEEATELVPHA